MRKTTPEEKAIKRKAWLLKNKEHNKEYNKQWRKDNYKHVKDYSHNYSITNKDKLVEYNKNRKEETKIAKEKYRKNNENKIREYSKNYNKNRKQTDPLYKLTVNVRCALHSFMNKKGYSKNTKTNKILGCSYNELKNHLESKWEPWMNWDNYGLYNGELNYGWDIDHIIPLSNAKTEEDLLKLCHYTNLQPLCSYTNRYVKRDLL